MSTEIFTAEQLINLTEEELKHVRERFVWRNRLEAQVYRVGIKWRKRLMYGGTIKFNLPITLSKNVAALRALKQDMKQYCRVYVRVRESHESEVNTKPRQLIFRLKRSVIIRNHLLLAKENGPE